MIRENTGAVIVAGAVVLGLIVAILILPLIQPAAVETRAALDEAAERAARRLAVVSRMVDRAVTADRMKLDLPEGVAGPSEEALNRAVTQKPDLLAPTRDVAISYRNLLQAEDQRYQAMTGDPPPTPEGLDPPAAETAQVSWLKQSFARGAQVTQQTLQKVNEAIDDLATAIASAATSGLAGDDHFRANWVLGGLHYQKALLLDSLAANRLAQAGNIRARVIEGYQRFASLASQALAIQGRLGAVSLADRPTGPQVAQPADAAAPQEPGPSGLMERAVRAIERAEGIPSAQPAAQPAPATAPGEAGPVVTLSAAEDPIEIAKRYEQQIQQQIDQTQQRVAEIQQQMRQPQQELDRARQQLAEFERQLERVEQAGYDVTDVESFAGYKKSYLALSEQIRATEAKIQALQEGTLAGAQLDPATDDYVRGKYTGGTEQVGLSTWQRRLDQQNKILADLQQAAQEIRDVQADLQARSLTNDQFAQTLAAQAQQVTDLLTELYEQLDRFMAEAQSYQEQAAGAADASAAAHGLALQAARKLTADAQQDLAAAQPAPEKPNTRLEWLRDYDSPAAAAERGMVDAFVLQAQIHFQHALALKAQRNVLAMLRAGGVKEVDPADADTKIDQALGRALRALYVPGNTNNALAHAEKFAQIVGNPANKFAWLGPATKGLVLTMLAQVQEAANQDAQAAARRNEAAEALRQAIQNNANSEVLQPYVHLLASLQRAAAPGAPPTPMLEPPPAPEPPALPPVE